MPDEKPPIPSRDPQNTSTLAAAGMAASGTGAAAVATVATVCCTGPVIAPLVVGVLGASGAAWAAGLKPYAPWLLGASFLMLVYAFRSSYRRPAACSGAASRRHRVIHLGTRLVLWVSAALWLAATLVNLTALLRS